MKGLCEGLFVELVAWTTTPDFGGGPSPFIASRRAARHGGTGGGRFYDSPMGYSLTDVHLQILEYVHGRPEQEADYLDVGTHLGSDPVAQLEFLADSGLLRRALRGDGFYHLTHSGQLEVAALMNRRRNRRRRRTQCREQLLAWIDNNTDPHSPKRASSQNFRGTVDGVELTDEDVHAAEAFLLTHSLIETYDAPTTSDPLNRRAVITERGQECVDRGEGIAAFLDRPRELLGVTQHVVVNGSGNNIAAAAGDRNQVTAALDAFDLDKARAHADAIRQAAPALGEIKDEIVPLLDQIQTEDRGIAQKATLTLYQLLSSTGTGALGGALALPLAQALGLA